MLLHDLHLLIYLGRCCLEGVLHFVADRDRAADNALDNRDHFGFLGNDQALALSWLTDFAIHLTFVHRDRDVYLLFIFF